MIKSYKDYIEYLKDNPQGYWFKRKAFGWGWMPVTWQGWLVTIVYVGVILLLSFRLDENATDSEAMRQLLVPLFGLTFILIAIAYKTGEKPKWTWGFPKKESLDSEADKNNNLDQDL